MNPLKSILLAISFLLSGVGWAGAHSPQNQIVCRDAAHPGSPKTIFHGPKDIDLRFPVNLATVHLKINGSPSAVNFKVQISQTRTGEVIYYSYQNPFFMSDIRIVFNKRFFGKSSLTATWSHDYPPATELNCEFSL